MNEAVWDLLTYSRGDSCIPGLKGRDVIQGSIGQGKGGHSLYERDASDKQRLLDPKLHARVAFWIRPHAFSLKDIKSECKSHGVAVTGNMKVLALRLALKNLPADVESAGNGYTITKSSPNKHGGSRVKTGSEKASTTANKKSDNAKKRSLPEKEKLGEDSKKAARKANESQNNIQASAEKEEVLVDKKCEECGVNGYVAQGRNCNKATFCCDCNDGEYKKGVSHCGCCEREFCHKCRCRFGGGCTSCQMMAE